MNGELTVTLHSGSGEDGNLVLEGMEAGKMRSKLYRAIREIDETWPKGQKVDEHRRLREMAQIINPNQTQTNVESIAISVDVKPEN